MNPDANGVRVIGAADVRRLLTWPELLQATTSALTALADPSRSLPGSSTQVAVPGAALHLKAGALLEPPVLSVKANLRPDRGSSSGAILVFDHREQRLRALVASADLTAMRTGAIAAVAARALVRTKTPTLALIGAGPVAASSLAALAHVLDVSALRVWSRSTERAEALAAQADGFPSQVCNTVVAATAGADVVITCTPAREPLVSRQDLPAHAVVLAMGSDSPGKRELSADVLERADIYVDVTSDAVAVGECAYLDVAGQQRLTPLGSLLAGQVALGEGGLTVFDSVGSAAVDAAATALLLDRATRSDVGTMLHLD